MGSFQGEELLAENVRGICFMYREYSDVHLCFPGLILPLFPSCFQLTAYSLFPWKAFSSNPCPLFSNCMHNDDVSASLLDQFPQKKHLYYSAICYRQLQVLIFFHDFKCLSVAKVHQRKQAQSRPMLALKRLALCKFLVASDGLYYIRVNRTP